MAKTDRVEVLFDLLRLPKASAQDDDAKKSAAHNIIFLMSGSFSPIHRSHIRSMVCCMKAADVHFRSQDGEIPSCVVAGVFSPSSESYVKSKLGRDAISFLDRCNLTAAALEEDDEFAPDRHRLFVARHNIACGSRCCEALLQDLLAVWSRRCGVQRRKDELAQHVTVMPVYGTDFMLRYPDVMHASIAILARDDDEGSAQKCLELLVEHVANVSEEFLFVAPKRLTAALASLVDMVAHKWLVVLPDELDAIGTCSSTRIRQLAKQLAASRRHGEGRHERAAETETRRKGGLLRYLWGAWHPVASPPAAASEAEDEVDVNTDSGGEGATGSSAVYSELLTLTTSSVAEYLLCRCTTVDDK